MTQHLLMGDNDGSSDAGGIKEGGSSDTNGSNKDSVEGEEAGGDAGAWVVSWGKYWASVCQRAASNSLLIENLSNSAE